MNLKDPARVLDDISNEQLPPDLDLLPGILAKIQQGNPTTMKPATKWRLAALLLALVLLVTFISLPAVATAAATALKNLIGYIPGVGTVDQAAPLRVLANPVTATRDGFTITVDNAVLDSTRTVLTYRISGPFPTWDDPSRRPAMCQEFPILRLADGRELAYPSREGGFGGGESTWKDVFPAVPAGETRAALVLPCLAELPAGDGPQNWEIPLAFAPAPPDMTVYPVVELPTPLPAATQAAAPGNGMVFTLQGIAALDEGYFLDTLLSWEMDPAMLDVQVYPDAIHLVDAGGQEVSVWPADLNPPAAPTGDQSLALKFQTAPVLTPGPANLVLDYVAVGMAASTSFTIDLGSSPQPGQTWELNKDLEVNGYPLRVVSAEYVQTPPGEPTMLMLYLASDSGLLTITAMDREHEILGTGGSPGSDQVPFRAGWYYKDGFPQGIVTVDITMISVRRAGPWSITWTPPAAAVVSEATPAAFCPDEPPSPAAPGGLPAGLGGRVAFSEGENHELFAANLDGSGRIPLGPGFFPDLSPDGQRVVYRELESGLVLRDLAGGEGQLIPGTGGEGVSDLRPMWSPDGRQIAFDRVANHTSDIYRVDPDGSDLQAILNGPEDESLLGWAPDGGRLFYGVTVADGQSIRVLDLPTGRSVEAALLPFSAHQVSLSPDGRRIATIDDRGIFLFPLDGQEPVLLLANPVEFANPIWSPDGRWILMSYWPSGDNSLRSPALLQPDTCLLLLVEEKVGDWLSSWVP